MATWKLESTERYRARFKTYEKNHPRELGAVLDNLQRFVDLINSGISPLRAKVGFIHKEPDGIRAIDQKGGHGQGLVATRLYIYCDTKTNILHLLCIGGKKRQNEDIQYCKKEAGRIKKEE